MRQIPCGEQPLCRSTEACNLGHQPLSTIAATGNPTGEHSTVTPPPSATLSPEFLEEAINWDDFNNRIEYGNTVLENVVTMSDFPVDKIRRNRQ